MDVILKKYFAYLTAYISVMGRLRKKHEQTKFELVNMMFICISNLITKLC